MKSIKESIKAYFFTHPTARLRVRQIERETKAPLPSVIRYAKELEKEGVLKATDIAGVKLYSADRASKEFLFEKSIFNIRMLRSSGLVDYITENCHNPAIIVFGSYARGEDIESSDIDLYAETEKINSIEPFEKKLGHKIQLFCYKDIKEVKNKGLADNIINGIKLNGFLEVFE